MGRSGLTLVFGLYPIGVLGSELGLWIKSDFSGVIFDLHSYVNGTSEGVKILQQSAKPSLSTGA